jgi:ABC-type transport system involved in multi-copper enzyme maturation permease subunit
MFRLIQIELIKSLRFKAIWWLSILYFAVVMSLLFGVETFINDVVKDAGKNIPIQIPTMSLYAFSGVWHSMTYLASYLKIFLAIISIILITNEFSYKTVKQQILNGLSRTESFWSKVLLNMMIALFATFVIGFVIILLGSTHTPELSWSLFIHKSSFLLAYFYEVFAYLSLAFLIATLVHRSGFAIGILMLYAFIIEPIIAYKLPLNYGDYLPVTSIGNIIQLPKSQLMKLFGIEFQEYISNQDLLISLSWVIIFHLIIYWYYQRKDF